MTHLFKLPNKFSDIFIMSINLEEEEIRYMARDKETGNLVEPLRTAKFIINDKMVHFDARECPTDLFNHIYQTLS